MKPTTNRAMICGCWFAIALLFIHVDRSSSQEVPEFECEAGVCYWAYVQENSSLDYHSAAHMCRGQQSTPVIIPDEATFNRILKQVRAKIPAHESWTAIWTGMRFDPPTETLTPEDAYWHWYPVHSKDRRMQIPWAFSRNVHAFSHVYLEVQRLERSRFQGLINREGSFVTRGVVCEKLE